MDEKMVTGKVKKAGISHFTFVQGKDGEELWLYHHGAARQYHGVKAEADVDRAIEEFQKNVP